MSRPRLSPVRPRRAAAASSSLLASLALFGACDRGARPAATAARDTLPATAAAPPTPARPARPPPKPLADMRLEVDTRGRRVVVFHHDSQTAVYPVAVGSRAWPTRHGAWKVVQVIWNPEWHPPEESWAEGLRRRGPGDPENPLGRLQIVYDPPRTIHGTNRPASIGKAVSHGSIRMGDAAITRLARDVMAAAGVERDSAWYVHVREQRHEKQIIDLPRVVPIRVY